MIRKEQSNHILILIHTPVSSHSVNKYFFLFILTPFVIYADNVCSETTLFFDVMQFEHAVGETESLVTDSVGISRAAEIDSAPDSDASVGSALTFPAVNTGLFRDFEIVTLQDSAMFVFDDGSSSFFDNALSVGNINEHEDDDCDLSPESNPSVNEAVLIGILNAE